MQTISISDRIFSLAPGFVRKFTIALILIALLLGMVTYCAMIDAIPLVRGHRYFMILINVNVIVLLLLFIIITKRIIELWTQQKKGLAGSRLHVRLVMLLSFLTAIPAGLMGIFSAIYLNVGIESWFGDKVQNVLKQSSNIAAAYLDEHKKVLSADCASMRNYISHNFNILSRNSGLFDSFLDAQVHMRNLSEAIVFTRGDDSNEVLGRAMLTFALEFEDISIQTLKDAKRDVIILPTYSRDRFRALVAISDNYDAYLLVGKIVDPKMVKRIVDTENTLSEYNKLETDLNVIKVRFIMIFIMIALLLLLISVWFGLRYANQLVRPIGNLIAATQKVQAGMLSVRVKPLKDDHDLSLLSNAFNRMVGTLALQKTDLLKINKRLDQRRQFIEAVLYGVPCGVIGLTHNMRIYLANNAACSLLKEEFDKMHMKHIKTIIPEISPIIAGMQRHKSIEKDIVINNDGLLRHLHVRVVEEKALSSSKQSAGYVLTFDDVSDLVQVQKQSAWSDVARKIAHEIKNPLTPIQLSAERLRYKYLGKIDEQYRQSFEDCITTITRHVNNIGNMVKEFSDFARMPSAQMQKHEINKLLTQIVNFYQQSHPEITLDLQLPMRKVLFFCDINQTEQVMVNLLQNAIDAVEMKKEKQGINFQPIIKIILDTHHSEINIYIKDNGVGFPKNNREALLQPYVTHKAKGTGLGLAIVRKITEDHGGIMMLQDNPEGGAQVVIKFKSVFT